MKIMTKIVALAVVLAGGLFAAEMPRKSWSIDGASREALVYWPETTNPVPLVFVFHGHGGNMQNTARSFRIHELWPEAAVVYMQGLPTPGQLTDPEGKRNGWNCDPNDKSNRDLKFFDAVYASLVDRIDTSRVYCTGHSNGGSFTYMLWGVRGDRFAAMAPSGALNANVVGMIQPMPILHVAGKTDPLVKYAWQDRMLQVVRRVNGCSDDGEPWVSAGDLTGTLYPSATGVPLVTLIHPGGHKFPPAAPEFIVRFFVQQQKR